MFCCAKVISLHMDIFSDGDGLDEGPTDHLSPEWFTFHPH